MTAAVVEGKFTIIDTEKLEDGKTKHLISILKGFEALHKPLLIVTG